MSNELLTDPTLEADVLDYDEPVDRVAFHFALTRRQMVQLLGAGLLIAVSDVSSLAQPAATRSRGTRRTRWPWWCGGRPTPLSARLHLGKDGAITLLTGKVECGQGARAELTQAAAEELRVAVDRISVVMADTALTPDDGTTAGSRSTPSTVPAVRQAAAAARNLLVDLAAGRWGVAAGELTVRDGKVLHADSKRELSYAELASADDAAKAFASTVPTNVAVVPVSEWNVLGKPASRPNGRDIVRGTHQYPSDIVREGMLYGKILRPPSYGATLKSIDAQQAKALEGVVVVEDGQFVGVAGPTSFVAKQALEAISQTAQWDVVSSAVECGVVWPSHAHGSRRDSKESLRRRSRQSRQIAPSDVQRRVCSTRTHGAARGCRRMERWQADGLDRDAESVPSANRAGGRLSTDGRPRACNRARFWRRVWGEAFGRMRRSKRRGLHKRRGGLYRFSGRVRKSLPGPTFVRLR